MVNLMYSVCAEVIYISNYVVTDISAATLRYRDGPDSEKASLQPLYSANIDFI